MPGPAVESDFFLFPEHTRRAVRAFLDHAPAASPFQDPAFCAIGCFGGPKSFHFVIEDDAGVVLYAFCTENFAASRALPFIRALHVHKGPIARDPSSLANGVTALKRWGLRRGIISITIAPQGPIETGDSGTLRLNLSGSEDSLLAGMDKGTRYEIRHAERLGIRARRATADDDCRHFFEIYERRGKQKDFGTLDLTAFHNLFHRLVDDRGGLFVSEHDGKMLGGVLILRAGERAHYVYGATDQSVGNALPALHPAMWAAIRWARGIGLNELDFGGFGPTGSPSVRRFKKGFGGTFVPLAPPVRGATWN